jgi:hypothetical protein
MLFGLSKNVVARFIQIKPVAVLELRGTNRIRIIAFGHIK